jgi:hypothetical protein
VDVEHASYGLQASRCDDQRNRLNLSLCVFRRALGGGDGEVRGRQIDSLDRLGSPAAASDVANSTFRQPFSHYGSGRRWSFSSGGRGTRRWGTMLIAASPGEVKVSGG